MKFLVNQKGKIAAELFDNVKKIVGVAEASKWMFSANKDLNGRSPIQAIKDGDEKEIALPNGVQCSEQRVSPSGGLFPAY